MQIADQDVGVTHLPLDVSNYGVATRAKYDQSSWAMVHVAGDSSETRQSTEMAPSMRRRQSEAPAFLIQEPGIFGNHRLGGLLTILHEIPIARNALLQIGTPADSYGYSPEWWKGQTISAQAADFLGSNGAIQGDDHVHRSFAEEIHRLMAFLDLTERSYGSVAALVKIIPGANIGVERSFFELIQSHYPDQLAPLMHIGVSSRLETDDDMEIDVEVQPFTIFEMDNMSSSHITTLNEAWDHVMWADALNLSASDHQMMAVLRKVGEVMVMSVTNTTATSIAIPAVWCPERYLPERKQEAIDNQKLWRWSKEMLHEIELVEAENIRWRSESDNATAHDSQGLCQRGISELRGRIDYIQSRARFSAFQYSNFDESRYPSEASAPCDLTAEEERLIGLYRSRIQLLQEDSRSFEAIKAWASHERSIATNLQRLLGETLTNSDQQKLQKPMIGKPFLLRGIATSRGVVYVCKLKEANLIVLEGEPPRQEGWWRLAYTSGNAGPEVHSEKVPMDQMLSQIWQETQAPLLVYATENALMEAQAPLNVALDRFIQQENNNFQHELNEEHSGEGEGRRSIGPSPLTPSKRKFRSSSADSMATNVALLGDSDRESHWDETMLDIELIDMTALRTPSPVSSKTLSLGNSAEPTVRDGAESPVLGQAAAIMTDAIDSQGANNMALGSVDVEMLEKGGASASSACGTHSEACMAL